MIYFSFFHIEIEETVAGLLGGGAKGMMLVPFENYWGRPRTSCGHFHSAHADLFRQYILDILNTN